MTEPLSGIARAIGQAIHRRPADPDELRGLAVRLEAFAEAEPRLEPDSHTNLLTQLARAVDPTTPRDNTAALAVLGLPAGEV